MLKRREALATAGEAMTLAQALVQEVLSRELKAESLTNVCSLAYAPIIL